MTPTILNSTSSWGKHMSRRGQLLKRSRAVLSSKEEQKQFGLTLEYPGRSPLMSYLLTSNKGLNRNSLQ